MKLWDLNSNDVENNIYPTTHATVVNGFSARPECISFHPEADNVLGVAVGENFVVCDLETANINIGEKK